mgnify:CR=1 FL=1
MTREILTKDDIAKRYHLSKKSVDKACSQSPESLPPFFKVGVGKNSPIRFKLCEVLKWEQEQLDKQREAVIAKQKEDELSLTSLLGL